MNYLLKHLRPETLASMAAEILANHADIDEATTTFHTEEAAQAYATICRTGERLISAEKLDELIEIAYEQAIR